MNRTYLQVIRLFERKGFFCEAGVLLLCCFVWNKVGQACKWPPYCQSPVLCASILWSSVLTSIVVDQVAFNYPSFLIAEQSESLISAPTTPIFDLRTVSVLPMNVEVEMVSCYHRRARIKVAGQCLVSECMLSFPYGLLGNVFLCTVFHESSFRFLIYLQKLSGSFCKIGFVTL